MTNYIASPTPHSNTGSNRHSTHVSGIHAGIDYLTVCGTGDVDELIKALYSVFGVDFDYEGAKPGTRGRYYSTILKSCISIELAYDCKDGDRTKSKFRLNIPGKPLNHVRAEELHKFIRYIKLHGYTPTRFDWAIDDYDRTLSLDDVADSCKNDDYKGANSYSDWTTKRRGKIANGRTIYIGSFQSDKLVRIYDKGAESKGEIDSIRYEVQWRGALAAEAFRLFSETSDIKKVTKSVTDVALGAVTFIVRTSSVASRCDTCGFWLDFIARVGESCKMSVRRLQPLISDKKRWIEKQVVGTLGLIAKCFGWDETINWVEREMREKMINPPSMHSSYVETFFSRVNVESCNFEDMQVIQSWN